MILLLAAQSALAQTAPTPNVQRFLPTGSSQGFATVLSARQLPKKGFGIDGVAQYAHRPFQRSAVIDGQLVRDEGAVDGLFALHLRAGYGITDFLEVSVDAPVFQYTRTAAAIADFNGSAGGAAEGGGTEGNAGFGDVALNVQLRPLSEEIVGLAVVPFLTLPSGSTKTFLTHHVPTFGARAVVSKTAEPVHVSANAGYRFLPRGGYIGTSVAVDDEFMYGAGVGFTLSPDRVRLNLEATGAMVVGPARGLVLTDDFKASLHSPLEVLADIRVDTPSGVGFIVGGGPGLTPAVGTPVFRTFLSVGYKPPTVRDTDGDGILDKDDACPEDPEDKDGFEDEDGCPEYDNDKDGIADMLDRCPNDPEDFDQFQDPDGCPDPDNDQDRIPDVNDRCPMQPEDYDGVEDGDGCPDADAIVIDTDRDGLMDDVDQCPLQPEDIDGFQDADGCPDEDNDQDTILDIVDVCPMDPENFNGVKDDDGCPDAQRVVVTRDRIVILEKVLFITAKAEIVPDSYPLLEEVTQTLLSNPQILLVRIEGHTDSRGGDNYNLDLSNRRANAIRDFLIEHGVEPGRLQAEGFGEVSPLVPNDSPENMEKNRRVEFHILKQE
ncbi:MAG: OmpA family protein [Myxococcota bacterium]